MSYMIDGPMLQLFRDGASSYQPEASPRGLAFESGDPQVSLNNLNRLLAQGLVIDGALVCPTGTLFLFVTGEQYYSPALRVGQDGRPTEALAEITAAAGFGDLTDLLDFYTDLPVDFTGRLPKLLLMGGD